MTQITIPELTTTTVLPLNSLFPFENTQLNQTQSTTLSTILSYVQPQTKLYINNILSGTYSAVNLIAGNNISFATSNSSNYFNLTLNSSIPNPLTITNLGLGLGLYKDFTTTYNFKSLIAGQNVTLTPNTDSITIDVSNIGETNTVSTLGTGLSLFKQKVSSDLQFKSIVAGTNISFDTSNPNQVTINSTGGSGSSTGQNIGVGTGRVFASNVSSTLRFKTIKAGTNITINDSASEITISSLGANGSSINNTSDVGSKILNSTGNVKTLIAGTGIIITDTDTALTLSTNAGNSITSTGAGVPIYKGFNNTIDTYEFKTLVGTNGITVTNSNVNEIVIGGNSTASVASTSSTNTLISSQVDSLTTLKVINVADTTVAGITNNSDNLTLSVLNNSNVWNANRVNNVPIVFPTGLTPPAQESTLVYRGTQYVTGTPTNLPTLYLTQQLFGSYTPINGQVFKISNTDNVWTLAIPTDSTNPLINFAAYYLSGNLYLNNNLIPGLTGLVAGTVYYLTSASILSTTPSAVIAGVALNTTTLWFKCYAA